MRFKAGDVIMREGEESDTMYLFLEGTVDVTQETDAQDRRQGFRSRREIDDEAQAAGTAPVFGEMSMFGDEPRSATVTAVNDCVLFELTRKAYEASASAIPALALALTRRIAAMLSSRVRKGNDDVLKLSTALSIALSR